VDRDYIATKKCKYYSTCKIMANMIEKGRKILVESIDCFHAINLVIEEK